MAHLGPDHPEVASIYHNLGGLEHARGRYRRAEPLARRAVAIREQALGPDHPAVAADIVALAAVLDGQGKFDASVPLYHRALAIFEATFGPDHYDIAVNLNNLAVIAFEQGDVAQAEHLYLRAIKIKEHVLGPDHVDVATERLRADEDRSQLGTLAHQIQALNTEINAATAALQASQLASHVAREEARAHLRQAQVAAQFAAQDGLCPASLKCLLEGFYIPVSYGRLREACQTDVDGTSIDTLEEIAGQLGLQAEQVMLPVDHVL